MASIAAIALANKPINAVRPVSMIRSLPAPAQLENDHDAGSASGQRHCHANDQMNNIMNAPMLANKASDTPILPAPTQIAPTIPRRVPSLNQRRVMGLLNRSPPRHNMTAPTTISSCKMDAADAIICRVLSSLRNQSSVIGASDGGDVGPRIIAISTMASALASIA